MWRRRARRPVRRGKHNPADRVCVCVFVFYMSVLAGCRWVQAVGLTPLAAAVAAAPPPHHHHHRSSPLLSPVMLTTGPRSRNPAAKPSSFRCECRCATLVYGRCVFRGQVMSHSACSSAWTRGNPGNSACRSKTAAGLAGAWWVHGRDSVLGMLWYESQALCMMKCPRWLLIFAYRLCSCSVAIAGINSKFIYSTGCIQQQRGPVV